MTRTSNLVVATVSAFQLCYGPVLYHYIVSHLSGMFPVFPVFSIVFNSLETKYHTFSMQFRKKKFRKKYFHFHIFWKWIRKEIFWNCFSFRTTYLGKSTFQNIWCSLYVLDITLKSKRFQFFHWKSTFKMNIAAILESFKNLEYLMKIFSIQGHLFRIFTLLRTLRPQIYLLLWIILKRNFSEMKAVNFY